MKNWQYWVAWAREDTQRSSGPWTKVIRYIHWRWKGIFIFYICLTWKSAIYFFKNSQIIGKNSQYQSSTNIPVSRFRSDAEAVEDQEMFQKEGRHQFWRFWQHKEGRCVLYMPNDALMVSASCSIQSWRLLNHLATVISVAFDMEDVVCCIYIYYTVWFQFN